MHTSMQLRFSRCLRFVKECRFRLCLIMQPLSCIWLIAHLNNQSNSDMSRFAMCGVPVGLFLSHSSIHDRVSFHVLDFLQFPRLAALFALWWTGVFPAQTTPVRGESVSGSERAGAAVAVRRLCSVMASGFVLYVLLREEQSGITRSHRRCRTQRGQDYS